jgi:hypothetical protein
MNNRELLSLLLRLLSRTTPYGHERTLAHMLPAGGQWDEADNYILEVGTGSTSLFACHLDTVCDERVKTKPRLRDGMIYSAKQRCPLGADDKAGALCLTAMIHANIPGVYVFHAGEECGCVGAQHMAETYDLSRFKRAVEFDRRGLNSVITRMGWATTCSTAFAQAMCDALGMGFWPDPTGVYTDVLTYADTIPEVTNISVGYYNNHTAQETLNAAWLIGKLIPRLYSVDWEALPVERDPKAYRAQWEYVPCWCTDETLRGRHSRWNYDDYLLRRDDPHGHDYECEFCGGVTNDPRLLREITLDTGEMYWLCPDCRNYVMRDLGQHEADGHRGQERELAFSAY